MFNKILHKHIEDRSTGPARTSPVRLSPRHSVEEQMGHFVLDVPINHRDSCQIERGMRQHERENPSGNGEDGAEHQASYRGLFDARNSLIKVVGSSK